MARLTDSDTCGGLSHAAQFKTKFHFRSFETFQNRVTMRFLMQFLLFAILLKNKYIEAALAGFKAKKELKKMTERDSVTVIIQMFFNFFTKNQNLSLLL